MRLRTRLAVALAASAVPLAAAAVLARAEIARRAALASLRDFVILHLESSRPGDWESGRGPPPRPPGPPPDGPFGPRRGPPPGPPPERRGPGPGRPEFSAFDEAFSPLDPAAPPFPPDLRAALEGGDAWAGALSRSGGLPSVAVAVRTPWPGERARYVLARRTGPFPEDGASDVLLGAAVVGVGLLAGVLLAAGPVVARIRRLTEEVRRTAADRYASPVEASGDDEVAELARAFNDAGGAIREQVAALEAREEALRAFVADTTHDLQTPLTVLRSHLADLRRRADAGEPPDRARLLEALDEAQYMGSLVHNLGAASKLQAGAAPLRRDPVDMNALVERVASRWRPVAAHRGVALEHAVPEEVLLADGDETLLEQAVGNLVDNAVRHNREGGRAAVVLETAPSGRFVIRVKDDGPGVPPGERPRLAERAFRGEEARRRRPEGQGLGLHIAREVAARHGLDLAFAHPPEGGLEAEIRGALRAAAPGA